MRERAREILREYWGYDGFRPLQEDIILSVLSGKDTLALMPTGGGKSITYQVPAMILEGVCIVITPLIALMKDQVEDLQRLGIEAESIYTGMENEKVHSIINKTIAGKLRFLYISPERLASENFRNYLKQMPVSLLAVDEAHCISQWGYDFRPSYLRIAEIRKYFNNVTVLALTATATPEVARDIQEKLDFSQTNVLSKSFRRKNLAYVVRNVEDKIGELVHILTKISGSAIVYARKRETVKQLAVFLKTKDINADYYHAGLSSLQRTLKQNAWKSGETKVIVATNAFGMGINKEDVRLVVHFDVPDSVEAYFQEAGRAGRDEKKAYAVMLTNAAAKVALKSRVTKSYPDIKYIKNIYALLGDFFQIAEGAGEGYAFELDSEKFISTFKLERMKTFSSIKILEAAGYLAYTEDVHSRSSVSFIVNRGKLDEYTPVSTKEDGLLVLLMRSYPGIFTKQITIGEDFLAKSLELTVNDVYNMLLALAKKRILKYIPGNNRFYIVYTQRRVPLSYLQFEKGIYEDRKKRYEMKVNRMIKYVEDAGKCRQLYLIRYFGQKEKEPCGVCDICLAAKKNGLSFSEVEIIVKTELEKGDKHIKELVRLFDEYQQNRAITHIRRMLDEDTLYYVQPFVVGLTKNKLTPNR
ncbi:MAG: RecQ family ATP-dependent DNA helicase [Culturomica sp.]|nr:RecQ family ATP-dependent DNA helicase [Culturomica sp.]